MLLYDRVKKTENQLFDVSWFNGFSNCITLIQVAVVNHLFIILTVDERTIMHWQVIFNGRKGRWLKKWLMWKARSSNLSSLIVYTLRGSLT